MSKFEDVVSQVLKALVQGPIGAEDMNAGDEFVEEPDKRYGRERFQDDEELDKAVVPQHYIPEYGRVHMLYKSAGTLARVIKADDVINDEYTDREIVVGGYASPQVIDREKHLIQKEGMIKDLPRFLANPMFANAMILHSNVQVGVVLPEWTHPDTGKVYKTAVDDIGLFVLIKIRTDRFRPKIVDKVIEDIEKGNLKAFSISGDAPVESREHKCADGQCFWVIPNIEFYEITICEEGVNQGAKLIILSKAVQGCHDGMCGLIRKQPVPEGVDVMDTPNPTPKGTVKKGDVRALGEKIGIDWDTALFDEEDLAHGITVELEHTDVTRGDPVMTAKIAWAHLKELPDYYKRLAEMEGQDDKEDKDAEETKEELSERVGEIAEEVGEREAVDMVKDVADAAEKLEKVNVGSGVGSGGSGDANTGADFGKPYSRDTAIKGGDPLIDQFFQAYRTFLARGASPEDAYFKLLEEGADGVPSPSWFGTRDDKFRQFLIQVNHSGLPIPTLRLRMQGHKEGEIVADPSMTAWDLLQTAVNQMRGMIDKDVSPVEHHEHKDGKRQPFQPSGLIDTRGMPQQDPYPGEAEESEEYYLNLALKALGALKKSDSTLAAIAESKIHEAYTRAMDGIYRLGHLDREQRIALSSAITAALEAFHKEIGDMGDLEIPAEDVALLMKHCTGESHLHPPDFETDACGEVSKHAAGTHDQSTHAGRFNRRDLVRVTDPEHKFPGKAGRIQRVDKDGYWVNFPGHRFNPVFVREGGLKREPTAEELMGKNPIKKHRDKFGSTAHHKTGAPVGGIAQPPQTGGMGQRNIPEQRMKTLLRMVRECNRQGAKLRLNPGFRNQPYQVTGFDRLKRPMRLMGNVAEVTRALRDNMREVEAIQAQRGVNKYAVPVEAGKPNRMRIIEGGHVDALELVREQVAAASFESAVVKVLQKQPRVGWRARDYLLDDKQQPEPDNVGVMGGVRYPQPRVSEQGGHANTHINSTTDIQDQAGFPIEQDPPYHGIAQQGAVNPPRGVQGQGQTPEYVMHHEDDPDISVENEGMPRAPEADDDSRGTPVPPKQRRP